MSERSLVSYIALPRRHEVRVKGWLAVLGYGTVHLAGDTYGGVALVAALVAWAVFELGLYQARYMVNDLIDVDVDRMHTAARARARLPDVPAANRWAIAVVVLRIAASAAIVALLPDRARTITIAAALGLVGVTVAYEVVRMPTRRWTPAQVRARVSWPQITVFGLVGTGYGLRFGFGVALAGAGPAAIAAATTFGWVFGTMVVVMIWTIEAAGLRVSGDTDVLARKSHLALMAKFIGHDRARLERPLLDGRPAPLVAALLACASALAVLVGVSLSGTPGPARLGILLAVGAAGGPVLCASSASVRAAWVVVATQVVAVAVLAPDGGKAALAVLMLVTSGAVMHIRSLSLVTMGFIPSSETADR